MATPNPWLYVGPASSFPNIPSASESSSSSSTTTKTKISSTATTSTSTPPLCKILQLSSDSSSTPQISTPSEAAGPLDNQLLIFRYRDKIHAINHSCPHRSYALSNGSLYDIEDFGVVLSAGIACPKHGWTFDLFTGESDRAGGYKLGVWEVETREEGGEEGVWVRRKVRKRYG